MEFTREDVEDLALMKRGVDDLNEKMDVLTAAVKKQHETCMTKFKSDNERICALEACQAKETTITTWKEQLFTKTTGVIIVVVAVVSFAIDHIIDFLTWIKRVI
ncbi:MAG: hypothetical protein M0Q91_07700 [Methanoregula sp.]|nr:hypothetical protein [Methanoregula sp.]